jgi:hypothetical protein
LDGWGPKVKLKGSTVGGLAAIPPTGTASAIKALQSAARVSALAFMIFSFR